MAFAPVVTGSMLAQDDGLFRVKEKKMGQARLRAEFDLLQVFFFSRLLSSIPA